MISEGSEAGANRPAGFFESLRSILSVFIAILQTRLELLSTELAEERERLKVALLLAVVILFFASLGVLLLTIFVVAIFWDSHRFLVLGGFVLFYFGLALIAALILRRRALSRPRLFSATLAELHKDHERLRF
jgi:uncharacterized membrane protein YqjE